MRHVFRMGVAVLTAVACGSSAAGSLESSFENPPAAYRPWTWWHWLNGNITKEGITADLEAMADVGLGGAQIFNAGEEVKGPGASTSIPYGPVPFNSPEWLGLVKHAAKEARRLGLELGIHNCAGWSSSGGPWNTPEHGMKTVVFGETRLKGPSAFSGKLAQPQAESGFYRDIAVLAFPSPASESASMAAAAPKLTSSSDEANASKAADGDLVNRLTHPRFEHRKVYLVKVAGRWSADKLAALRSPLTLDDGYTIRPVPVEEVRDLGANVRLLKFTLKEGRKRQIRKMCSAAHLVVLSLQRVAVGAFELPPDLAPGAWRDLTDAEIGRLFS